MANLSIRVLGSFQVTLGDKLLTDFRTKKVQALLVYLVIEREPQRRETAMTLLWPGLPERSARSNLRQIIYYLRKSVPVDVSSEDGDDGSGSLLIANRQVIQINPGADVQVDAIQFEFHLKQTHTHDHLDLGTCRDCHHELEQAVELYQGDFLTDFYLDDSSEFEEWALVTREAYRRKMLDALDVLTSIYTRQKAYVKARAHAERQLEIDNLRESAYRQLMEIMALSGQRAEALTLYDEYRRLLAEELGIAPSAHTSEIYDKIRVGDLSFDSHLAQGVGGYELKEEIGQGLYATIHRARQPAVGREVAVKIIRRKYANDPEFIRRFEAEAQTIARLEHPYIVPLYDYWRDPDGAYLVMRYLQGGSLSSSLESGPWDPDSVVKLVEQLASALSVAHHEGVIHRDIKPANILLDGSGNAYLTDFGIAKDLNWDSRPISAETMLSSPDYISPEQIMNEQVSPQTDIYSFGAVLYEILTGEKPYPNSSLGMLIHKHLNESLPPVSDSRPDLSHQIDAVIQVATAKQPADRYADAMAMAEAFRQAVQGTLTEKHIAISKRFPAETEIVNPYKGLRAFQEADAQDFFGRELLVEQLISRLASSQTPPTKKLREGEGRFLVVVGASGSGKSSVVKAGLIPTLRQGAVPGSEKWFVAEMVPGIHPLEELEAALWPVAVNPPPGLVEPMQRDERGLLRIIRRILPDEEGVELLLVIDQFEELFTLVEDERRRAHFIDSLLAAITAPRSPLRVVITLRADFYDRPLQYQPLGRWIKDNTEVVLPLQVEELSWAIQEPARRLGVELEEGLVTTIVADTRDQPGALPLMQFAMTELFEARQGHSMTHSAYERIGGALGALGHRSEEVYAALDTAGQLIARQLFLRLVTIGEEAGTSMSIPDTRRRVFRSELEAMEVAGAQKGASVISFVIEAFGKTRLLTFDRHPATRDPTVEVAHEALFREWPRLRRWLDGSRADVRLQRQLALVTVDWIGANEDESFLIRGSRLEQFEEWAAQADVALTTDEQAFLEASLAYRERQATLREQEKVARERLRRRVIQALVGGLIVALLLATIAGLQWRQATEERELALQAEATAAAGRELAIQAEAVAASERDRASAALSLQLAAQALNHVEGQLDLGLLLSIEAAEAGETAAARNSMLATLHHSPNLQTYLHGHEDQVRYLAFNPDGQTLLSASDDGVILRWDIVAGQPVGEPLEGLGTVMRSMSASPDGRVLATGNADGTVILRDAMTGEMLKPPLSGHSDTVWQVAFSPDGRMLASASGDGTIRLWEGASGEPLDAPLDDHEAAVTALAFSPDGRLMASGSRDNTIIIWDMATKRPLGQPLASHLSRVNDLAFSPDGQTLVSASDDQTLILWDTETREPLYPPLEGHTASVNQVAFSPDGQTVASAGSDNTIILWNVELGLPIEKPLLGHSGPIRSLAFDPMGRRLASGGRDNKIILWDLDRVSGLTRTLEDPEARFFNLAFSPNGRVMAASSGDGAIRLWDPASGEPIGQPLDGHEGRIWSLSFSPDGQILASSGADNLVRLWDMGDPAAPGQPLGPALDSHTLPVSSVAFSPDGQSLASASLDRTIVIWNVATGQPLGPPLTDHGFAVLKVAISPDGQRMASADISGNILLWDLNSREIISQPFLAHPHDIYALAFSPDGRILASGGSDDTVALWDLESESWPKAPIPRRLLGHYQRVEDVSFSPDGKTLASAADDGAVIIWNVATGQPIGAPLTEHLGAVLSVAYSPDGQMLASVGQDGSIILRDLRLESSKEWACRLANRNLTQEEWQRFFGDEPYRATCPDLPVVQ